MKKARKLLVLLISAAMILSLTVTAFAADPGYEYYAGYQFTGNDPWGGELNVTVRFVEGGKMEWTFTDIFEDGMIYQEIAGTELKNGKGSFYIEGAYSYVDNLVYQYSGTIELIDMAVVITYQSGSTVTLSSEGDSSSRQVAALPVNQRTVALSKYVPNGGADYDIDFADYIGYMFTGTDPWGGQLNITVRSIAGGGMDWTYTDTIDGDMIYKELYGTPIDTSHGYGIVPFSIEGYYSDSLTMTFNYTGTVYLAQGKVYVTLESGETFTYSSEGGSSSRHVAALPGEERTFVLTKYIPSGGAPDGWLLMDGKWYYSKNGMFVTGWLWDGYAWYYMTSSGAMATGWIYDGGWYYLTASGAMATGWTWDGNAWYYMKDTGIAATGWLWDGTAWYYLDPYTGAMVTGWLWDGTAWYYLAPYIGAMVTGQYVIDGVTYTFADNGMWIG